MSQTEIAALRLEIAKACDNWIPEIKIHPKLLQKVLDQLEAERQRADDLVLHVNTQANMREKAEAEIEELKGDQVPVAWPDMPFTFEELEQMHGATFANGYVRGWVRKCESVIMKGPLFTAPQKPVVLPTPYYGDSNCLDKREVIAAIEAAGGIVKDGE